MLLNEADKPALKDWIIPKVETISDADAGVLADYVIALIAIEDSETSIKQNCSDSLLDFLHDNTGPFIDEVLAAVKSKSYLPKPKSSTFSTPTETSNILPPPALSVDAPPFNPPTGPSADQFRPGRLQAQNGRGDKSRKRRYNERDTIQPADGQDPHYSRAHAGDRPIKQMVRKGGRHSMGGFAGQDVAMAGTAGHSGIFNPVPPMPNLSGLAPFPPGFPDFDPTDPMSFFRFMSIGLAGMPGMPVDGTQLGTSQNRPNQKSKKSKRVGRCKDYDTKGICALGRACPYEHGGEIVVPASADGTFTPLGEDLASRSSGNQPSRRGRGRYDEGGLDSQRTPASFSQIGPSFDQSNITVVVEQIPVENFSENTVRDFFSQFGKVEDVRMLAYKHLAVVTFDNHVSARRAYESPKAVFDNRFVKVYWYKSESLTPQQNQPDIEDSKQEDEDMLDLEEFQKNQAEIQKAFEERQKKQQETSTRLEEIEKKILLHSEELRLVRGKLVQKLKTAQSGDEASLAEESALLETLSSLQAEAQDLGYGADDGAYPPRGRGRGGYRGRVYGRGYGAAGRTPRGRGYTGTPFGGGRSGVKRLDNRPRRILITPIEPGSPQDEALRLYLTTHFEHDSIDPHPERTDGQIITFKERYVAEMFADAASNIAGIGKVELAWVSNAAVSGTGTAKLEAAMGGGESAAANEGESKLEDDEEQGDDGNAHGMEYTNGNNGNHGGEADYDVADDEDRWMAA